MKHIGIIGLILISTSTFSQDIANSAEEVCPLKIGSDIPNVTLKNIQGEQVDLHEFLSQKPTLLIFYRGSWCPYCNIHLAALQEAEEEILEMGFQIIAISPDLPVNLKKSIEKNKLSYTLLSDSDLYLSKQMGLAFKVSENTLARYKRSKIDLEVASGEDHKSLPVPAAYLVDKKGLVHFSYVNPNYKTRIKPHVLAAAARSMKD